MRPSPHASRRCGHSLVEALVVIALGAVVMGGVVTGATALLKADTRIANADLPRRQLLAIASYLRKDLHRAESYQWRQDQQQLTLRTPDGEVQYKFAPRYAQRGMGGANERLPLPAGATFSSDTAQGAAPALLTFSVAATGHTPSLRIDVAVGRDLPGPRGQSREDTL